MARTLEAMASEGFDKLTKKAARMKSSWEAAKGRMKTHYGEQPFGPTRTGNFNAGIDGATYRTDPDKWKRNWLAKMAE